MKSVGTIDISDKRFPKLGQLLKGLAKDLKAEGRGDVVHYKEIPAANLSKIFTLVANVTNTIFKMTATSS